MILNFIRKLFLISVVAWLSCGAGDAQIIYSNNFTAGGASNIWGTSPTVASNFAGGQSPAVWSDVLGTNDSGALFANGSDSSTLGNSWLLPFFPTAGYIYTLTGSLTFTGNPGSWVGFGFAQNDSTNVPVGFSRFSDSSNGGPTGYDWMILTEGSGNVQYFAGPKGSVPIYSSTAFSAGPQTVTAQIVLNTVSNAWTVAGYVNGSELGGNYVYANPPPIGAVGLTQTTLASPVAAHWNYVALSAVAVTPVTNTINATVTFSPSNPGLPLNRAFGGLSYEKVEIEKGFFDSNALPLVNLFSLIGPAVLRIGGGTVDQTGWGGVSNTTPITESQVDQFAGFMKSLPTNWTVIYGLNLFSNTPASCAAEASYAANALGSRLLGFEIGNEPEFGFSNYSAFLARWRPLAAAVTNAVPGWAVTNHGVGWIFADADLGQGVLASYTDPFARDESGVVSLLTQHYYRAAGASTNDTMQLLLPVDTKVLVPLMTNIVGAAVGNCILGARVTECGSYSVGGVAGVSDAYGAALWSLDCMFTMALHGGQGINFHGGGRSPYSPLKDDGMNITSVGPEFYGLKMLSLIPPGNVVPATLSLSSNINFTAYGIRHPTGAISVLLNNKDTTNTVIVTVNPGPNVATTQLIEMTGPSLDSTDGFTLGGAPINIDGSWIGGVEQILGVANGQLTVAVPPLTAILLNPVLTPPAIAFSLTGNQLTLNWPANYSGWQLQSNLNLPSPNWFPVPGSANSTTAQITIRPGASGVFYRLVSP